MFAHLPLLALLLAHGSPSQAATPTLADASAGEFLSTNTGQEDAEASEEDAEASERYNRGIDMIEAWWDGAFTPESAASRRGDFVDAYNRQGLAKEARVDFLVADLHAQGFPSRRPGDLAPYLDRAHRLRQAFVDYTRSTRVHEDPEAAKARGQMIVYVLADKARDAPVGLSAVLLNLAREIVEEVAVLEAAYPAEAPSIGTAGATGEPPGRGLMPIWRALDGLAPGTVTWDPLEQPTEVDDSELDATWDLFLGRYYQGVMQTLPLEYRDELEAAYGRASAHYDRAAAKARSASMRAIVGLDEARLHYAYPRPSEDPTEVLRSRAAMEQGIAAGLDAAYFRSSLTAADQVAIQDVLGLLINRLATEDGRAAASATVAMDVVRYEDVLASSDLLAGLVVAPAAPRRNAADRFQGGGLVLGSADLDAKPLDAATNQWSAFDAPLTISWYLAFETYYRAIVAATDLHFGEQGGPDGYLREVREAYRRFVDAAYVALDSERLSSEEYDVLRDMVRFTLDEEHGRIALFADAKADSGFSLCERASVVAASCEALVELAVAVDERPPNNPVPEPSHTLISAPQTHDAASRDGLPAALVEGFLAEGFFRPAGPFRVGDERTSRALVESPEVLVGLPAWLLYTFDIFEERLRAPPSRSNESYMADGPAQQTRTLTLMATILSVVDRQTTPGAVGHLLREEHVRSGMEPGIDQGLAETLRRGNDYAQVGALADEAAPLFELVIHYSNKHALEAWLLDQERHAGREQRRPPGIYAAQDSSNHLVQTHATLTAVAYWQVLRTALAAERAGLFHQPAGQDVLRIWLPAVDGQLKLVQNDDSEPLVFAAHAGLGLTLMLDADGRLVVPGFPSARQGG